MTEFSRHAARRCAQRGLTAGFLTDLLSLADIEAPVGDNCRVLRVSSDGCGRHPARDRLRRYAIVWSDTTHRVVTVLPMQQGRSGRRYRRQ